MSSEHHYNDPESNYFLLFVISVVLFPLTYWFIKRKILGAGDGGEYVACQCSLCQKGAQERAPKKKGISIGTIATFLILVVGWALFVYVATNIVTATPTPQENIFDPYQILGLEYGASMDEIKKAHRKLSLIYHPDKATNPNDPAVQERYMMIGKAYEALTDELARSNWEKYGNPDGPRPIMAGIALPSWLVRPENMAIVLGVYMALLIVGLPTVVCCWWRSWKKYDSTKVMNNTMALYYHKVEQLARVKVISELISASQEYKEMQIRNSDELNIQKISKLVPEAHAMKKKPKYTVPYAIKTNALFYAQMSRLQKHLTPGLKEDLDAILKQVRPLLAGFITIATAKALLVPIVEAIMFLQQLTQSTWNKEDLLQLPHITPDMVDVFNSKKKNCGDMPRFRNLGQEKRSALLKEEGLNEDQIADVEKVLNYLPCDVNIKFECKVEGEQANKITARSVVTMFYKVYKGQDEDEVEEEDDGDVNGFFSDSDEEMDDAARKRMKERREKRKLRQQKKKQQEKEDSIKRYVHAPHFPEKREESWWIVIGEPTKYELVGVQKVGAFSKQSEGKIKFLAPDKPGVYNFVVHLMCDGYLGCDKTKPLRLVVVAEDPAKIALAAAAAKQINSNNNINRGPKITEIKEEGDSDYSDDDGDYSSSEGESD